MSESKSARPLESKQTERIVETERRSSLRQSHLPVVIFMSTKGGTNKTVGAVTLRDRLMSSAIKVAVVDSDTNNPDVHLAVEKTEGQNLSVCMDLDTERGVKALCNTIQKTGSHALIIVRPGGDSPTFVAHGPVIAAVAAEAGRKVVVVWSIDTSLDSFVHLEDIMEAMEGIEFWVSRPLTFGKPDDFETFNHSIIGRKFIAEGRVINLPSMPEAVFSALKGTERQTPLAYQQSGSIFARMTLEMWRGKLEKAFKALFERHFTDDQK